ncbi:MAG TPA: YpmA family protein [Clostridia bacterium]|nr:YpmA family protein [Clostridia bacterium]HHY06896.1 YpmA family protein [Clostridia bacterium]
MSKEGQENKLELLATKSFNDCAEMYKVVDFLNKYLKDKGIMLGLIKNKETKKLSINIYEFY